LLIVHAGPDQLPDLAVRFKADGCDKSTIWPVTTQFIPLSEEPRSRTMSLSTIHARPVPRALSRRAFLQLSGVTVGAGLLAACAAPVAAPGATGGEASAPDAAPASLIYLSGGWFVPELVEAFEAFATAWAAENNVEFTIDLATQGALEKLATAIEAGEGVNLAQIDYAPTAIQDAVVDVTEIAQEMIAEQGEFFDPSRYQCTIDGKWFAIPFGQHPRMVNYRQDWFAEAGYDEFPATWDEVLEAGRALKANGHPYGWTMSEQSPADGVAACLTLLWCFGGQEWNEDGSLALDSEETLAALNYAIQLYNETCDPAVTSYQEASNNQAFLAGQISMTYNVNTIYLPAVKDAPQVAEAMNHVGPPEGPGGRYGYTGVAEMIALNHTEGANLDAALQFMRDFFSTESYGDFLKLGQGYLIPSTPYYDDKPVWPEDPKLQAVKTVGAVGRLNGYALPSPNQVASTVQTQVVIPKMFSTACSGGSAEAALEAALQEIADIQAQAG
jgi:multiple sugar transport system substrate-binding protein